MEIEYSIHIGIDTVLIIKVRRKPKSEDRLFDALPNVRCVACRTIFQVR